MAEIDPILVENHYWRETTQSASTQKNFMTTDESKHTKYIFDEVRKPRKQIKMVSQKLQTEFEDVDQVLHPIDYRRCIRCGLNDVLSPGVCKYIIKSAEATGNGFTIQKKWFTSDRHFYNNSDDKENTEEAEQLYLFKEPETRSFIEKRSLCTQTVLGLNDLGLMMKRAGLGKMKSFKIREKELESPKNLR